MFLLGLILVAALPAWGWQGVPTEHLFVAVQEGISRLEEAAARAEEALRAAWALWLPGGVETGLPRRNGAVPPEELDRLLKEAGLPERLQGPRFDVFLYADPEVLWRDDHRFGIAGTYLASTWGLAGLADVLRERARQAGEPADWGGWGIVLAHCPTGDCPALLAHEFTHALQDYVQLMIPTDRCPEELDREPRLVVEGMACWTEFALDRGGDFDLLVRGPVAVWLGLGGCLADVPAFLLYEIGATLFEYLSFRLSPPEMLALFSSPLRELLGLSEREFPDLFEGLYGGSWEEFLAGWRGWLRDTGPVPGAELVYEERRLGIGIRESFLWPVLAPGERDRIRDIRERIQEGVGTVEELLEADEILKGAWAEPTPELVAAVDARIPSLRDWARAISGPLASAEVSSLWLIKAASPDRPDRYLRAFIRAVNDYLVAPAPSPLGTAVP